jgi:DnaJ-class molecular chaperone
MRKVDRRAVKYMRHMPIAPLLSGQENCPDCEGSGWTVEGWEARDPQSNPFAGDCKRCNGTGAIKT